ncbi:hypothetical protein M3Y97_00132400 [Aphelenchoides bicaudatus]|nr:hypothetical protein M3Y97_00132400 [Aphelenchoides bicaudatus]
MQVWTLVVVQCLALTCGARRPLEPSGYDGQNWPASMVIDTSNLPDNSAQHDLFYGGGGASRSTAAFEHEQRPESAHSDQRISTTHSSSQQTTTQTTTQRPPRPEFTPTTHSTQHTSHSSRTNTLTTSTEGRSSESNRRGDTGDREQSNTPVFQSDGYGEQRIISGRQRQGLPTAENLDNRHGGQVGFRQDTRRPVVSNEYDGPHTQSSLDRQHESHEQEEERERQSASHSHDSVSHREAHRENLPQTAEQQNEYESPQLAASQDKEGLLIESVPSGYERQVHGDFSIDNSGRHLQHNQHQNSQHQHNQHEYESQESHASFSSSHDTQTRRPSPIDEQQARLVAKLLNIDRQLTTGYSTEDSHSESIQRTENTTSDDQIPVPSPFLNETTNSTIGEEINQILTRPLNASDQPFDQKFEDKNLQHATLEIIKLLHDEPQHRSQSQQQQSKETMKVSKKVRVIRLPPLSGEEDSEEIVLVGERGNATIHRGKSSMFIEASTNQKRRRV